MLHNHQSRPMRTVIQIGWMHSESMGRQWCWYEKELNLSLNNVIHCEMIEKEINRYYFFCVPENEKKLWIFEYEVEFES